MFANKSIRLSEDSGGDMNQGKKLHLKDWNSLCLDKSKGGIGIRRIDEMDKALIGKQSWRLITKLESHMANILLPKYCKKEQFIEVKPQSSNSWIWKSLLIGRDVVLKGIDVQV